MRYEWPCPGQLIGVMILLLLYRQFGPKDKDADRRTPAAPA